EGFNRLKQQSVPFSEALILPWRRSLSSAVSTRELKPLFNSLNWQTPILNQRCFSCSAAAHFTSLNQTVNQYFIDCTAAC
ncbi:hypothetical protein, partial [Endozoicomonas sp. SESOKO2]|uniref:hypothetical protein n=1 Tax=Endozoicomonas sp. SESOKO2 TaxID=2828743 RepID=UPI0021472E1D